MGLEVGVIPKIEYSFHAPQEAKRFVAYLMTGSLWIAARGHGQALGFWTKQQMASDFNAYRHEGNPDEIEEKAITDWLSSLPWDNDYIRLYFNS